MKQRTTKIVWNDVYEEYQCEQCKAIIHYNFGFKVCPYCARKIVHTDERKTRTFSDRVFGVIFR